MAWKTRTTGTKHNETCTMSFGNTSNHSNCPRCEELKAGAVSRTWGNAERAANVRQHSAYCYSVAIYHTRCTKETNPSCACGKMSFTD